MGSTKHVLHGDRTGHVQNVVDAVVVGIFFILILWFLSMYFVKIVWYTHQRFVAVIAVSVVVVITMTCGTRTVLRWWRRQRTLLLW